MDPKAVSGRTDSMNSDVNGPKMNGNALPGLVESIKLGDENVPSWLSIAAAAAAAARAPGKPQLPPEDNTDNESDESDTFLDFIRDDSDTDADISERESRQWRKRVLLKIRSQQPKKKNKARGESRGKRRQTNEMLACRANEVIPPRPEMEPVDPLMQLPPPPESELKPYYDKLAHLGMAPDRARWIAIRMHYYDTHIKPLSGSPDAII